MDRHLSSLALVVFVAVALVPGRIESSNLSKVALNFTEKPNAYLVHEIVQRKSSPHQHAGLSILAVDEVLVGERRCRTEMSALLPANRTKRVRVY